MLSSTGSTPPLALTGKRASSRVSVPTLLVTTRRVFAFLLVASYACLFLELTSTFQVEDSLKKLRTNYIDLLYVHWWDYSTSIPELMQSLNDLVKSGKVLYLGISDTPGTSSPISHRYYSISYVADYGGFAAWIVSQANEYARHHGLAQFVVYQGLWNLGVRDLERDVIPMARANGMSIGKP